MELFYKISSTESLSPGLENGKFVGIKCCEEICRTIWNLYYCDEINRRNFKVVGCKFVQTRLNSLEKSNLSKRRKL